MAVSEDEVVDPRVCAQIILGEEHEELFVLAQITRLVGLMLQAAVFSPLQAEVYAPPRMDGCEEYLTQTVAEDEAQQLELRVGVAEAVAVGQEEDLVAEFQRQWFAVHDDAAFFLQIVVGPDVMVTGEEVHLYAEVRQLADFAQEAREALRHHQFILMPEVEHIAQHIYSACFVLDTIKEAHESALLRTTVLHGAAAQMGIGDEINGLHIK